MRLDRNADLLIKEPSGWGYVDTWASWFYPSQLVDWMEILFGAGDILRSAAEHLATYLSRSATLDPAVAAKASAAYLDSHGIPHSLPKMDRAVMIKSVTLNGVRIHANLVG